MSELLARKPHYAKRISGDVGQGTRPGPGDPNEERASYVGCIAGALSRSEYEAGLAAAGFAEVSVAFTHQVGDGLHSAIIKATKPVDTGQPNGVTASTGHAALPLASQRAAAERPSCGPADKRC